MPKIGLVSRLETGFRKHWLGLHSKLAATDSGDRVTARSRSFSPQERLSRAGYGSKSLGKRKHMGHFGLTTSESKRSEFAAGTHRKMLDSPAGITAQIMEIARIQTKAGVAGDVHREELAGKSYFEAFAGRGSGRALRSIGI
jgi:hypothetical protein